MRPAYYGKGKSSGGGTPLSCRVSLSLSENLTEIAGVVTSKKRRAVCMLYGSGNLYARWAHTFAPFTQVISGHARGGGLLAARWHPRQGAGGGGGLGQQPRGTAGGLFGGKRGAVAPPRSQGRHSPPRSQGWGCHRPPKVVTVISLPPNGKILMCKSYMGNSTQGLYTSIDIS